MNAKTEAAYQICTDTSDCIELSFTSGLYLKPITKLSITVTIPHLKSGQVVSNKEIIDKLQSAIRPEKFVSIKATKSNMEFLRFDAELVNRKKLEFVISKIDQKGIKLGGFNEVLKIRATEGKIPFPSRHDWDSYFKDAKHMNEKKPGERPDTVHIRDIPCEWFCHNDDPTGSCPSLYVVSKVLSSFGEIRALDIPYLDPYRKQMSALISGINKFSFDEVGIFDVYVQYKEYIGFAKCMHTLQAKKLAIQRDTTVYMANIKVDFDKTKHLSDASMKSREIEREKLQSDSANMREKSRMKREISAMKKDAVILEKLNAEEIDRKRLEEKDEKKKAREEKRKQKEIRKRLKKLMAKHKDLTDIDDVEGKLTKKVAVEERKLVVAERNIESVRLFDKIFDRIKTYHQKETAIKTSMQASGIQSEPLIFGYWFNANCQILMKKKKTFHEKFAATKTNENWLHYKKCSHKLKKASHNQKLKFIGSCLKNAKDSTNKEQDEARRKELVSCKKMIKLTKARYLDQLQAQQKRVDKVMRGKIQVIFLPCDDENKVALSPASSNDLSSSSGSSHSSDSESDNEKKAFAGKMHSDHPHNFYGNQGNMEMFQGGNFYHNNYRPRGNYGMGQGPPFPYDNRGGRGFRFFRPFNRGFRGGPYQNFDNRGRGFYQYRGRFPYDKNRGRGGFIDNNKYNEHPIQLGAEKWFKRGNNAEGEGEEESYYKPKREVNRYKPDNRSPSWSDSRSGSRKRSRSWSRSRSRSVSYNEKESGRRGGSRSSSNSSRSRRSRSNRKSRSDKGKKRGYSRDSNSEDENTTKNKKKATRHSSSSESGSRSRDRRRRSIDSDRSHSPAANGKRRKSTKGRSRSRSSDSSRPRSRARERGFDDRSRHSRSRSRNRYSDRSYSRSPSDGRYRKQQRHDRMGSQNYDEYYSDEYPEQDHEQHGNYRGYNYNPKFVNRRYNSDFRGRGSGPRPFYNNYRGNNLRPRRPRGAWRGRGRGYINNYNQTEHDEEYNEQCMNLYKKYFNRINENDSYKRDGSSSDGSYRGRSDYDSEHEYKRKEKLISKYDRRRDDLAGGRSPEVSPTKAPVPLKKRLRHYGSSDSDEKGRAKKKRKYIDSSDSDRETDKVNANQQREKDLRERLSRKLESKKLLAKKTTTTKDLQSDDSEKKVTIKSKIKPVTGRQKEQIGDSNARYREEEEISRADKLQKHSKSPSSNWKKKRNIRERLDDSDDSASGKKKHRRKSLSVSDEDSLYGPLPPKHILSRTRRN